MRMRVSVRTLKLPGPLDGVAIYSQRNGQIILVRAIISASERTRLNALIFDEPSLNLACARAMFTYT
jgi:hypothetical protein